MSVRGWSNRGAALVGALTGLAMLFSLAACGETNDASPNPSGASVSGTTTTPADMGSALVSLPDDGITLSQSTPLNKWTRLNDDITDSLVGLGFDKDDVESVKSKTLDDQADAIEDYVAEHGSPAAQGKASGTSSPSSKATNASKDPRKRTVVIAPVADPDDITRQYGDYVSQTVKTSDGKQTAGTKHLVSALNAAKKSGMSVILVANTVEGFTSDTYVGMSTAREIAHTQATLVANKLALAQTTAKNPKSIEIMLPASDDDETNKEVFAGIWQVLGPYFRSGVAVSPSGLLDSSSDENSWSKVVFKASDQNAAKSEFMHRLGADGKSSLRPSVDGVIAMNDMVAAGVTSALSDMKYQGSAADINPEITIGGIVDNIAGNRDLKKDKVPEPKKDDSSSVEQSPSKKDQTSSGTVDDPAWPIVTGYGVYLSNILQVVNGHQWSTGLENRKQYADDIALAVKALNTGTALTKVDGLKIAGTTEMNGSKVPTIHEDIISVSASNMKKTLIDPGYIRPADAGL
ncbi:hypothetical protein KIH77_10300 [Bifidobacterium sp. 82T24]|uniref:hypothetical protein n=1 Tax=Bifidobacterium pluvialisilvae TaxID=2834436 RepID=UPI001C58873A|nr:hypothetical protein [Bifidobacterium pluvialisilvae]MBW3089102.1 hypothetical protein [Bifidobacterium pluvialisilvae]